MRWRLGVSLVVAGLIDVQRSLGGECLGECTPAITLVVADMVSKQASSSLSEKHKQFFPFVSKKVRVVLPVKTVEGRKM